jgi:hypothetical protein
MASLGLAFTAAVAAVLVPTHRSDPPVVTAPKATPSAAPAGSSPAPASSNNSIVEPFVTVGPNGEHPLSITVESGISVGRLALQGRKDGNAQIDPQTGSKQVGANMIDLGGLSYQGKATIIGQPLKPVRIELPQTVILYSPSGAEAELSDFRTDLSGVAMLDASGQLQFNFGATISSKNGQGGDFRGRIPIRVEYY